MSTIEFPTEEVVESLRRVGRETALQDAGGFDVDALPGQDVIVLQLALARVGIHVEDGDRDELVNGLRRFRAAVNVQNSPALDKTVLRLLAFWVEHDMTLADLHELMSLWRRVTHD